MRTLYEIGAAETELQNLLEGLGGEISDDEIGKELERYFENLGAERDEKIRRICGLISNFEIDAVANRAQAKAIEEEINDLKRAAQVAENAADRLKKRVVEYFRAHDIKKLDLGIFKPRRQGNSVAPLLIPAAWENAPSLAPALFQKTTITLDTAEIKLALHTNGALCPACGKGPVYLRDEGEGLQPAYCAACDWDGKPEDTVRFGPKGEHLRLR